VSAIRLRRALASASVAPACARRFEQRRAFVVAARRAVSSAAPLLAAAGARFELRWPVARSSACAASERGLHGALTRAHDAMSGLNSHWFSMNTTTRTKPMTRRRRDPEARESYIT
jgi:hypothetical protein